MLSISHRDAPEATGDEPEDADFETPKIYEAVSLQLQILGIHIGTWKFLFNNRPIMFVFRFHHSSFLKSGC